MSMWLRRLMVLAATAVGGCAVLFADGVHYVSREGAVDILAEVNRVVEVKVEGGVADLIRSGETETLKVEHVSGRLFVTPLTLTPAELVIIDLAGRSYRLKFVMHSGSAPEEMVVIAGTPQVKGGAGDNGATTIGIIRALASGQAPQGSSRREVDQIIFEDEEMRLRATGLYELPGSAGYTMRLENISAHAVVVPVQALKIPGLLAVSVLDDILSAHGKKGSSTELYAVVAR